MLAATDIRISESVPKFQCRWLNRESYSNLRSTLVPPIPRICDTIHCWRDLT